MVAMDSDLKQSEKAKSVDLRLIIQYHGLVFAVVMVLRNSKGGKMFILQHFGWPMLSLLLLHLCSNHSPSVMQSRVRLTTMMQSRIRLSYIKWQYFSCVVSQARTQART